MQNTLALVRECASLASGTLATLTGRRLYSELDDIHARFIEFIQTHAPENTWRTWQDAWESFWKE